jgi:hypothetical protein
MAFLCEVRVRANDVARVRETAEPWERETQMQSDFFFTCGWTWIGPKKHAFILARGPNDDLGYGGERSRGPPIWVILLRAACCEPVSSRVGEGGVW